MATTEFPEDWEARSCSGCGQPMAVTGQPPIVLYECTQTGCPGGDPIPTNDDETLDGGGGTVIPRRHAIEHFKRTGGILPGHQRTIAEYRAQSTREDGDCDE